MEYPLKLKYRSNKSVKQMKSTGSHSGSRKAQRPDAPRRKAPAPNHPTLVVNGGTGAYRWERG